MNVSVALEMCFYMHVRVLRVCEVSKYVRVIAQILGLLSGMDISYSVLLCAAQTVTEVRGEHPYVAQCVIESEIRSAGVPYSGNFYVVKQQCFRAVPPAHQTQTRASASASASAPPNSASVSTSATRTPRFETHVLVTSEIIFHRTVWGINRTHTFYDV